MIRQKFAVLEQLLGCYFHQDWPEEFDGDVSALRAIIDAEPKDRITAAISEIDALLELKLSETELGVVLVEQVGCYFDPNSRGVSYTAWLKEVRHDFKKA